MGINKIILPKSASDAVANFKAQRIVLYALALIACLTLCPSTAFAEHKGDSSDLETSQIAPEGKLLLCDDVFSVGFSETETASQNALSNNNVNNVALDLKQTEVQESCEFIEQSQSVSFEADEKETSTMLANEASINSKEVSALEAPENQDDENDRNNSLESTGFGISSALQQNFEDYEANVALIEVKQGTTRDEIKTIIEAAGEKGLSVEYDAFDNDILQGLIKLRISDGLPVRSAVEILSGLEGVIAAQPNFIYKVKTQEESVIERCLEGNLNVAASTAINDRWSLESELLESIRAYDAWDLVKAEGSVAVAVIDTGADLDHPDLQQRIVASYNSCDPTASAEDTNGHGTHVAGIIAGTANNGLGVAGISYNANLVIIKSSKADKNSFDTESIARAYNWLLSDVENGKTIAELYNVRVINMSVGGRDNDLAANMYDDVLNNVMCRARDAGIVTVCAAGNKASDKNPYPMYPGDSEACLSVINIRKGAEGITIDPSSNYNVPGTSYKDVCAPGVNVYSTWLNGHYAIQGGTSMAAPIVSSVAALMFAANPNLSAQLAMSIIEETCSDLGDEGWDEVYGYGEVNALAAIKRASSVEINGPEILALNSFMYAYSINDATSEVMTDSWSWSIVNNHDVAEVDAEGHVVGIEKGNVILRASCKTVAGAEFSVEKSISVVDATLLGTDAVTAGECTQLHLNLDSGEPTISADDCNWHWEVSDHVLASVDQSGTVSAFAPGVVVVRAICKTNSDLVAVKTITIV